MISLSEYANTKPGLSVTGSANPVVSCARSALLSGEAAVTRFTEEHSSASIASFLVYRPARAAGNPCSHLVVP